MSKQRSRVIVGVGVLCFVGVVALWLAASGDRAIADQERLAVTRTLVQAAESPVVLANVVKSKVSFAKSDELVQRLSLYLKIEAADPTKVKAYLVSPSGTRALIVDGARSPAAKNGGLEGWFGADGMPTAGSLAAFAGEPVSGHWVLSVEAGSTGRLVKWSLTSDVGSNTSLAGMETYGEYDGGGCDCRVVGARAQVSGGLLLAGLLLGLGFWRRRS